MCSFVPGFLCPTWRLRESSVPLWEWWLVHVHCVNKGWGKSRSTVGSMQNRVLSSCVGFHTNKVSALQLGDIWIVPRFWLLCTFWCLSFCTHVHTLLLSVHSVVELLCHRAHTCSISAAIPGQFSIIIVPIPTPTDGAAHPCEHSTLSACCILAILVLCNGISLWL